MEDIFKNTLEDLDKTYSELGKMKDQLLSMSLSSIDPLFEEKDPAYKLMDQKSTNEVLSTLKKDLLPLFKDQKFKKGVSKVKKYIKFLQENLEKQK